jgi:hypothetical protein
MKLHKPQPLEFTRLMITRQGDEPQYLNFVETNIDEMKVFLEELITKEKVSPFIGGKKTSINIRRAIGGDNKEAKSISFYGLTPLYVKELILKNFNNETGEKNS